MANLSVDGLILNPKSNRQVKVGSQSYRRLVREGIIKPVQEVKPKEQEVEVVEEVKQEVKQEVKEVEYDEAKLQTALADLSTDIIKNNLTKVVEAQKLDDKQMDDMLRKMLYKKLCMDQPDKKAKTKKTKAKKKKSKKPKFKVVEPSSSESESE